MGGLFQAPGCASYSLAVNRYVVGLEEIDGTQVAVAGGKGANLGELSRIDGIRVPPGFCVTTDAFRTVVGDVAGIDEPSRLSAARIREAIEAVVIPDDLRAAIEDALADGVAYAVRSSATAEDLPTAS